MRKSNNAAPDNFIHLWFIILPFFSCSAKFAINCLQTFIVYSVTWFPMTNRPTCVASSARSVERRLSSSITWKSICGSTAARSHSVSLKLVFLSENIKSDQLLCLPPPTEGRNINKISFYDFHRMSKLRQTLLSFGHILVTHVSRKTDQWAYLLDLSFVSSSSSSSQVE